MQFAILVYETESDFAKRSDPATAPAYMAAYLAYSNALREAGVARGGAGLLPPKTATTLRSKDQSRLVQDGPFANTKEQLGGFFLIEVPDLDTALSWASRCPAMASGSVEVRATLPPPPNA